MTFTSANMPKYKWALIAAWLLGSLITPAVAKAEAPVPVANFTSYSDKVLSDYLTETLNADLKNEIIRRKLAVFALTAKYDGQKACYAMVGLTEAASKGRNSRAPASRYSAFGRMSDENWAKENCVEERIKSAIESLNTSKLNGPLEEIDSTFSLGGARATQKPSSDTIQLSSIGITSESKQSLFDIVIDSGFGDAFDYRYVQSSIYADATQFSGGDFMCVAFAGVEGRSPNSRNFRWPGYTTGYVRFQKGGTIEACKRVIAEETLNALLKEEWTAKGLLDNFAAAREDGIPLPVAPKPKVSSQPPKVTTASTSQRNRSSCTNDCVNGSCTRKFPDGTTEHWQAPRKFNPITGNWEWDITTNACGL